VGAPKTTEFVVYIDEKLARLIPKFVGIQMEQLELMKTAAKNKNYLELKFLGHRMKGSCGGYGFSILGDLGREIENAAVAQDGALVTNVLARLENCLVNLKIEYRKT